MGIRETMNRNPRITLGVITAVVAIGVGYVVVQVMAARRTFPTKSPDDFFTVDDGKTFFSASRDNVPPFTHEGKEAVHAYVFECKGKRFVGYVERFTPEAHKQLLNKQATPATYMNGRELKKPGETNWVKSGDLAAADKVTTVLCPDGQPAEPVEP